MMDLIGLNCFIYSLRVSCLNLVLLHFVLFTFYCFSVCLKCLLKYDF